MFMYAKYGNRVHVGAYGAKASIKHCKACLEVIQGHPFQDHLKRRRWTAYYCI